MALAWKMPGYTWFVDVETSLDFIFRETRVRDDLALYPL